MKQKLFFIGLLALMLLAGKGWGQPWTYNFGTGTGSHTSGTSSSFLPTPTSGSTYVRVGATGGSVNLENSGTGILKLGSDTRLRILAPTTASIVKASVYNYTAGKSFYTKFSLLFGGSDGGNVSSGIFSFWQGDGATFSDANTFSGTQMFTGLRFSFGANGGAITSEYRNGGAWSSLGSSPVSQGNVYTFEIFGNNTTASIDYTYNGTVYSVANNAQDIWINGVLIGNDLAKAQLGNNANIDSWMFYGESSASNVANIFVDDIIYSNSIAASYTTNLNYFSKSSGNINTNTNWTTNNDGTGSINPANFTTGYINYNIRNNATPAIDADWTVSGTNSAIIIGDGTNSASLTANNNISFNSLTINTNGVLTIATNKQATISGTLTNNAGTSGLVVASGGSLIHSTAAVPGTVQRSITAAEWGVADDGWHLISSSVASQNIDGSWTPSGGSGNYDFYAWSEATNTWLNQKIVGNSITAFEVGRGYIAAYEQTSTKAFTGNLNVANQTFTDLSYTPAQGNGWHLLGNPFASAIKWNDGNWALTAVAGTAKIWNESTRSYTDLLANAHIPVNNGFMVQVSNGTNSITIPILAREHNATAFYKSADAFEGIKLVAAPSDLSSAQELVIRTDGQATNGFDFYTDSRFLPGGAPQFYSMVENEQLSTNSLLNISPEMTINLGFMKKNHEVNTITLVENTLADNLYLTDLKLNFTQKISENPVYSFTSTEGDDPNRFLLHFGAVGVDEAIPATAVTAYVSNNILYVLNANGKVQADVLDVSGRLVFSQNMLANGLSSIPLNLPAGVYVVRISNGLTSKTNKVIVQ